MSGHVDVHIIKHPLRQLPSVILHTQTHPTSCMWEDYPCNPLLCFHLSPYPTCSTRPTLTPAPASRPCIPSLPREGWALVAAPCLNPFVALEGCYNTKSCNGARYSGRDMMYVSRHERLSQSNQGNPKRTTFPFACLARKKNYCFGKATRLCHIYTGCSSSELSDRNTDRCLHEFACDKLQQSTTSTGPRSHAVHPSTLSAHAATVKASLTSMRSESCPM